MQVKDIMTREVITARRSTTLAELVKMFKKFHTFPLVPVIEEDGRLVGTLSFKNLIETFQPHRLDILKTIPFLDRREEDIFDLEITPEMGQLCVADDLMEKRFISIDEDASGEEAYKLMRLHLQERLPVTNRLGMLVGMVGIFDIFLALFRQKGIT